MIEHTPHISPSLPLGVALSSELTDALETHKNQVTMLNQQINGLSLEVNEAKQRVKQLQDELTAATAAQNTEVTARETELVRSCESLQRQLDMANKKIVEVTSERECLENERLSLISEYEGREGQLREEIKALRADLHQMSESRTDLAAKLEMTETRMAATIREHVERAERADAIREDAVAEVEILQARISELTEEVEVKLAASGNNSLPPDENSEIQVLKETVDTLQEAQDKMEREHKAQLEAIQGIPQSLALCVCASNVVLTRCRG